ncbi:unnamed protein product, partial [marine sediment metagenome]
MARREWPLTEEQEAEILELADDMAIWKVAWKVGCSKRQAV